MAHHVGSHQCVRRERCYKLIHYYSEGDYWELFDRCSPGNFLDQYPAKTLGTWRSLAHSGWVELRQDLKAMRSLVVPALLGTPRGIPQTSHDISFGHLLDLRIGRQGIPPEPLFVVIACQRLDISKKPRLHALNHQMCFVIRCAPRFAPAVNAFQMLPASMSRVHRFFRINQQHGITGARVSECNTEVLEGSFPASARNHPGAEARRRDLLEEEPKPLSALRESPALMASSLHVDTDAHQRFPPI